MTRQFFEANAPLDHFLKKKILFRYGLQECVDRISGLKRVSFGQGMRQRYKHKHTKKYYRDIPYRLRASPEFEKEKWVD